MLDQFIRERREDILTEIVRRLAIEEPSRDTGELLHNLPTFIEELRRALESSERSTGAQSGEHVVPTETAADQGRQRHRAGFPPTMVAKTFGLICEVVAGLAANDGLYLDAREVQLMNQCIDEGIATALDEYWTQSSAVTDLRTAERLGFLAHELRNALSTASLAFEALREGRVGSSGRTVDVLDRSLTTMAYLVNNTLVEVQLKSSRGPRLERVRLVELIANLDIMNAGKRSIPLSIDVDPDVVINVDPVLFGSALTNLVQNARKFTRPGGEVKLRARRTSDDHVLIEVEDECGGLKVPPEQLFQPFVQGHEDRSGVGLGLSIARESVTTLRGELSARDLPGKGCVFSIRLPLASTKRD